MTGNALKLEFEEISAEDLIKHKKIDFVVSKNQFRDILPDLEIAFEKGSSYLIDSEKKLREHSIDIEDITLSELGAVVSGSKIFVKKNIASFNEYLLEKHKEG